MIRKKPIQRKVPLKRSGYIQRKSPIKKSSKPISPVSAGQSARMRKYIPIRNKFISDNPVCQMMVVPECTYFSTEVHHPKGKIGDLLYDVRWFVGGCAICHRHVEINPAEAKEKGLSHDRDL